MASVQRGTNQTLSANFRRLAGTKIYRSSRPEGEMCGETLRQIGIKSLIDLRSSTEINTKGIPKNIFEKYDSPYLIDDSAVGDSANLPENGTENGKGYYIHRPLANFNESLRECVWYVRLMAAVTMVVDRLLGSSLTTLMYVRLVMNSGGGQSLFNWNLGILEQGGRKIHDGMLLFYYDILLQRELQWQAVQVCVCVCVCVGGGFAFNVHVLTKLQQ